MAVLCLSSVQGRLPPWPSSVAPPLCFTWSGLCVDGRPANAGHIRIHMSSRYTVLSHCLGSLPDAKTLQEEQCSTWVVVAEQVLCERIAPARKKGCRIDQERPLVASKDKDGQDRMLMSRGVVDGQLSDRNCRRGSPDEEEGQVLFAGALDRVGNRGDSAAYVSLLRRCSDAKDLSAGKFVHAHIIRSGKGDDRFLGNLLVQMYGNCGSLKEARAVFDEIHRRNVYSWNIMIGAYVQNGHLVDARSLFDKMSQRDVVSWSTMIAAYAHNGNGKIALGLFQQMQQEGVRPNNITFTSILDTCSGEAALGYGKAIHANIVGSGFESDIGLRTALISMYGKCGSPVDGRRVFDKMSERSVVAWTAMVTAYAQNGHLQDARSMFDKMAQRDVVSWNAMIASYAQNGFSTEAIQLFRQMDLEPNNVTFISILDACANLADLVEGKAIHASIIDSGVVPDVVLGNALVNMYGKCGCLTDATTVFGKMLQRDTVSYNVMITAFAQNGHAKDALKLFGEMQLEGVKPDEITFTSILSACSHAGRLDDGWRYFISMMRDHDVTPTVEHYGCMIDLLGRAGQLDEAQDLINSMPFKADAFVWSNLLGACRLHGDVERGEHAAERIFELDPKDPGPYVSLSNMYAAANRWDDVARVRKTMDDKGMKKQVGCSCIEVNHRVHEFVAGDTSHPQKVEIYAELKRLSRQLEEAGYVPDRKAVLYNVEEDKKEFMLCYHSEKLAIAFGLIATSPGAPLRIIKNLRVCSDCHAAVKFISKISERKIIVRDVSRFHHFEHGVCSCGDYW